MTSTQTDPYDPPRIAERSSIEYPLVAVVSGEVAVSAAFRPLGESHVPDITHVTPSYDRPRIEQRTSLGDALIGGPAASGLSG
jgi:hypothetical protein